MFTFYLIYLILYGLISGEAISCISDGAVPTHVLNTYCWITYTFTLPNADNRGIAHPGLGNDYEEEKRIHAYYQWVPFMLFFQVSSFKLTSMTLKVCFEQVIKDPVSFVHVIYKLVI